MSKSDLSMKLQEIEQSSSNDVLKLVLEAAEKSQGNADDLSQIAQVIHSRNLLPDLLRSLLSLDKQSDKNNQVELLSTLIQDQQNLIRKLTKENESLREDVTDLKESQIKYSVDEEYLQYSKLYAREVEERARLKLSIDDDRGVQTIEAGSPVTCAVSLHDGNLIATSHDGAVKIWDLSTQKLVREFANDVPAIWSLEPIKGTDLLFVASTQVPGVGAYNWRTGKKLDHIEYESCISMYGHAKLKSFGMKKKYIISSMQDGYLTIFDITVPGGKLVKQFGKHDDCVFSCEILPRGRLAIGDRGHVNIWNMQTEQREKVFMAHKGKITSLVLLHDEVLLSGSDAGMIKMWDLKSLCCLKILFAHTTQNSQINQVIMLGANLFASASEDKSVKLWDLEARDVIQKVEHKQPVLALCYFNRLLVTASADSTIKVVNCSYTRGVSEEQVDTYDDSIAISVTQEN